MELDARAYWLLSPGIGEIRPAPLRSPGDGELLVRTVCSGISRGTESLVFQGLVPESQHELMRAPFQEGDFPGPVKYGYLNVGVVEEGDPALVGRTVFCLYPHQTRYVVPASAVTPLPPDVPAERAVLAGTMETAVNAAVGRGADARRPRRRRRCGDGRLLRRRGPRPLPRRPRGVDRLRPRARPHRRSPRRRTSPCPRTPRGGCDLVVHASASAGRADHAPSNCSPRTARSSN